MQTLELSGSYTDLYQISMGQAYFLEGNQETQATFDYFFRKLPFDGGYVLFAGLEDLLISLSSLYFTADELAYLQELKFDKRYIDYLKDFKFKGDVWACREGDVVFPTMNVLRIQGNIIEAQLVETLVLNLLNYQSLVATKAARMRQIAGDKILSDFGLRRAQSLGGIHGSRAAMIGGFNSSSNVYSAIKYQFKAQGTMAHAYVQSQENELEAFRKFAKAHPENCVLLVDTYDTLKSGIPNAIIVAKEMKKEGKKLAGIRLDSGDLAHLSKKAREMLNAEGLQDVKIVASNQLDEYVIKSLMEQKAPIDIFGVGTSLITGKPDAALDGVYKLSMAGGKPRLKLSENMAKVTLPGNKQVYRLINEEGNFYGGDVVAIEDEENINQMFHPFEADKSLDIQHYKKEPLLEKVMEGGKMIKEQQPITQIAEFAQSRLSKLGYEYKRFQNPHIYKIGISDRLNTLRNNLREKFKR